MELLQWLFSSILVLLSGLIGLTSAITPSRSNDSRDATVTETSFEPERNAFLYGRLVESVAEPLHDTTPTANRHDTQLPPTDIGASDDKQIRISPPVTSPEPRTADAQVRIETLTGFGIGRATFTPTLGSVCAEYTPSYFSDGAEIAVSFPPSYKVEQNADGLCIISYLTPCSPKGTIYLHLTRDGLVAGIADLPQHCEEG